jgi:hypothetical protein
VSLCIPSSSRSPDHDPHRTIYYLGNPLGRFAGLKHRQLARHVGVIITTERIRRTSSAKSIYSATRRNSNSQLIAATESISFRSTRQKISSSCIPKLSIEINVVHINRVQPVLQQSATMSSDPSPTRNHQVVNSLHPSSRWLHARCCARMHVKSKESI